MLTRRTFFRRAAGAVVGVLAAVYVPRMAETSKELWVPNCNCNGGILMPPDLVAAMDRWWKMGAPPVRLSRHQCPTLSTSWRVTA